MRWLKGREMYREINDYEMLYLICDSDDNNYGIVLEKYYPLIIKISTKYKNIVKKMGYEQEDLIQIGYLTLYQTIKGYDGDKNSNLFYTYFLKSLENSYIRLIKENSTNKKRILNEAISYDNYFPNTKLTYAEIFPDSNTLSEPFINDGEIRYKQLKYSLNFDLSCILDLKIEGFTNKEISTLLSFSESKVLEGVKLIRQKRKLF